MKMFSLICATYGRTNELRLFMESLLTQSCQDFELIIVDQNDIVSIDSLVNDYKQRIDIVHCKTSKKGLSRARNIGLSVSKANWIAFPDDDCAYSPSVLRTVSNVFKAVSSPGHIALSLSPVDSQISAEASASNMQIRPLGLRNLFQNNNFISFCIFLNFKPEIKFDEQFGVGAAYPSTEESDFVLRLCLDRELKLLSCPNEYVHHPFTKNDDPKRTWLYGIGYGAFLRKHISSQLGWIAFYGARTLIRGLVYVAIYLLYAPNKAYAKLMYLCGMAKGFAEYKWKSH